MLLLSNVMGPHQFAYFQPRTTSFTACLKEIHAKGSIELIIPSWSHVLERGRCWAVGGHSCVPVAGVQSDHPGLATIPIQSNVTLLQFASYESIKSYVFRSTAAGTLLPRLHHVMTW